MRSAAFSRAQESRALSASMTTIAAPNTAITDFSRVLTEIRLSMFVSVPDKTQKYL